MFIKKLIVLFFLFVFTTGLFAAGMEYNRYTDNPLGMRMYKQTFTVKYANSKAGRMAKLEFLPLPDGKEWAFSSRWDDNRLTNNKVREILAKYGCKGTFYLNKSSRRWNGKYARELMKSGFSIGGHTMDHPYLPKISRNNVFYQIMANRIEREVEIDTPINSFAFPYGRFKDKNDNSTHRDIAEYLYRAGYHHNTYNWFIKKTAGMTPRDVSSVMPVKAERGVSFEKAQAQIEKYLKSPWCKVQPCITLATHANQKGKDWEELEKILKKYSRNPRWWYCNQTEYAAYRYQYHHTRLLKKVVNGSSVTYTISRPHPGDLGNDIYLSLMGADGKIINLKHDESKRVPQIIDRQPGINKFSKISISLKIGDDKSNIVIRNSGKKRVKNLYYKLIFPPSFSDDASTGYLKSLAAGKTAEITIKMPVKSKDEKYLRGKQYYAAMIELNYNDTPIRIWSTELR